MQYMCIGFIHAIFFTHMIFRSLINKNSQKHHVHQFRRDILGYFFIFKRVCHSLLFLLPDTTVYISCLFYHMISFILISTYYFQQGSKGIFICFEEAWHAFLLAFPVQPSFCKQGQQGVTVAMMYGFQICMYCITTLDEF